MKALSIRHPWVDCILAGTKTIEVRTWSTRHRGPLLLHASAAYGVSEREATARLGSPPPSDDALGAIVGVANLVDCRPVTGEDWPNAGLPPLDGKLWAWVLAEAEAVPPVPLRGQRMLFEVDPAGVPLPRRNRARAPAGN